jgi:hypothetical protein
MPRVNALTPSCWLLLLLPLYSALALILNQFLTVSLRMHATLT